MFFPGPRCPRAPCWGHSFIGQKLHVKALRAPRVVRAFIKKLRQKLGDDARRPTYIFTEPRVGYRMAKPGDA